MDRGEIEFRLYEQRGGEQGDHRAPKLNGTMEEALKQNRQWDEETETRRTLQNRLHMYRATQLLGFPDSEKCSWLWSKKT